jgi:uncharacterized membrane protein YphA (DoxX/SURF4 family)
MNVVLWIIAGLLAVMFFFAGLTKATQPVAKLATKMAWVEDYSPATVRLIGILEILGALGLILPAALGIVPVLTPLAAAGLAAIMVPAAVVHVRRGESSLVPVNVVLFALAAFVAVMRFGSHSF